jgi:condensin complex subunit 2
MEEISTSFCFICLLHLANEEGLELNISQGSAGSLAGDESFASSQSSRRSMSTVGEGDDLSASNIFEKMAQAGMGMKGSADDDALGEEEQEEMGKVGRLQWLQIEKDPNAGRSA